jgi:broad specificity phosphatase PhoE
MDMGRRVGPPSNIDRVGSRDAEGCTEHGSTPHSLRDATKKDASAVARVTDAPWADFRADWKAVLSRVYKKMNDDRLLAVAAGVVFYGLLALFLRSPPLFLSMVWWPILRPSTITSR